MKGMDWSEARRIGMERKKRCRESNGEEACRRMDCPRCYPKVPRNPWFHPAKRRAAGEGT